MTDTGYRRVRLLLDTRRGDFLSFVCCKPEKIPSSHPRSCLFPHYVSYPHRIAGTRRHNEILGHQRGGPILRVETSALTICRAYVSARDSAQSCPTGSFPGTWRGPHPLGSFGPAGKLLSHRHSGIVILLFKSQASVHQHRQLAGDIPFHSSRWNAGTHTCAPHASKRIVRIWP